MFDFHEKRKIRKILFSKVSIVLMLLVTGLVVVSVYERFVIEREMAHKLEARVAELNLLKERAAVLGSKVEHMQNERGIEEEIRSRFDVVKDGEQVVVILDDEPQGAQTSAEESEVENTEQSGFFESIRAWFW